MEKSSTRLPFSSKKVSFPPIFFAGFSVAKTNGDDDDDDDKTLNFSDWMDPEKVS